MKAIKEKSAHGTNFLEIILVIKLLVTVCQDEYTIYKEYYVCLFIFVMYFSNIGLCGGFSFIISLNGG